jgi:hypothetical protein
MHRRTRRRWSRRRPRCGLSLLQRLASFLPTLPGTNAKSAECDELRGRLEKLQKEVDDVKLHFAHQVPALQEVRTRAPDARRLYVCGTKSSFDVRFWYQMYAAPGHAVYTAAM